MLNYAQLAYYSDSHAIKFAESQPFQHVIIDNFLAAEVAQTAFQVFPELDEMQKQEDFRQKKAQDPNLNKFHPIFSTIIFQHLHSKYFLAQISEITGIPNLIADNQLYAAGLAQGANESFLNIHLDNNSLPGTSYYRRLNLILYLNKNWTEEKGGHLELWSSDLSNSVAILPKFNRLAVFAVNGQSWHSYRPVNTPDGDTRKSINIYFYTAEAPNDTDYHHVTYFRARNNQRLNQILYPIDNLSRKVGYKLFGSR